MKKLRSFCWFLAILVNIKKVRKMAVTSNSLRRKMRGVSIFLQDFTEKIWNITK